METGINERIRELITHLNIKDNKFAEITGIPQTTLNNYFKRGSEPNIATFIMIINSFEFLNPMWLLTGRGEMILSNDKSETNPDTKDLLMKTIIDLSGENAILKMEVERLKLIVENINRDQVLENSKKDEQKKLNSQNQLHIGIAAESKPKYRKRD